MAAGRAWLAPRSGPCSAAPLPAPRAPAGTRFPPVTLLHGPVRGAAGLAARQTGGRVSAPLLTGTQSRGCCLPSLSLGFPLALQIFDDYNALPPSRAFEGPQRAGPRGALSKTLASSPIPHPALLLASQSASSGLPLLCSCEQRATGTDRGGHVLLAWTVMARAVAAAF